MDNPSDKQKGIPDSLVDSLVHDVLRKNNLDPRKVKGHLSHDQKRMLQELFGDLQEQVEAYVNKPKLKRKKIQKPKEDEKEE
ncbi:spore coat protein [Bacillus sp. JZ8]